MKRSVGLLVLMLATFASVASAGTGIVIISFSGVVSSTPAPSTWMLMGLGLLLAFFAFRKSHSLPGGRTMAAVLMLLGVSAYEIFTGHALETKASAFFTAPQVTINGGSPYTFNATDNGTEYQVVNGTGSTITINSVVLGMGSGNGDYLANPTPDSPTCRQGVQLAPGGTCYVQVWIDLS